MSACRSPWRLRVRRAGDRLRRRPQRIDELRAGHDRTREVEAADLAAERCVTSTMPAALAEADFYIVTVPTPIDDDAPARSRRHARRVRDRRRRAQARRHRRLRIDGLSRARPRKTACRCWKQTSGLQGRQRFHRRLLAGAHQSGRQGAPLRDHHQGRVGAGRARRSRSSPTSTARWSRPASTARRRSRSPKRPR